MLELAEAEEAATDAKRTIESRMPREGIEFFLGRPFGLVGATVHPPCITCCSWGVKKKKMSLVIYYCPCPVCASCTRD